MTEMAAISSLTLQSGVAVLKIDSPPVNALGHHVRTALADGVARALDNKDAEALVLICGGRTFFAGADIREIGKPLLPPLLKDIIDLLETADKPTIAAIHGTALGGGFELALACHYRIATESAQVGLPEAALGLLPGAGGTQRTPRLIGVAAAIDMIVHGRSYKAAEAKQLGLIDTVAADGELEAAAIAYARELVQQHASLRRVRDLATDLDPGAAREVFAAFRAEHPELFRHLKAPDNILKAIQAAVELSFDEGLQREAELSKELVASPESAAQRYLFFAERTAAAVPGLPKGAKPHPIRTALVLGEGAQARALRPLLAKSGIEIVMSNARGSAAPDIVFDFLTENTADTDRKKVNAAAGFEALIVGPATASDLQVLADAYGNTSRILGIVFRQDVESEPVMEILAGAETAPEALAAVAALARKLGKVGVFSGPGDRTLLPQLLGKAQDAAATLAREGVAYKDMDEALVEMGFPQGWLPDPAAEPEQNPATTAAPTNIIERLLLPIAREGERLLKEGQALRASDIDIALVKSTGWPVHTGGPMYWAAAQGHREP